MKEFIIDLFCGAGGTSTGVHLSNKRNESHKIQDLETIVIACVNHDAKAIESHRSVLKDYFKSKLAA